MPPTGVLMSIAVNAHELRKRLFLGDEKRAEVVSSKTFLSFYRESTRLPVADGIPSRLVGLAYSAMQPCRAERSVRTNDHHWRIAFCFSIAASERCSLCGTYCV